MRNKGKVVRILILLFLIESTVSIAGDITTLTPSEANTIDFQFISWPEVTAEEIIELQKEAICTPIEFNLPINISKKHPDWTQVLISGEIYLNEKVLSTTATYSYEFQGRNLAYACLPLSSEYKVDLRITYNPLEISKMPMCPPTFELKDFGRFVESMASE